jgi:hypothetical protein
MTILNAAGDGMYYIGYFYVGIKCNCKETREIKFQTLRRKSKSRGHAAMQPCNGVPDNFAEVVVMRHSTSNVWPASLMSFFMFPGTYETLLSPVLFRNNVQNLRKISVCVY